MNSSSSGELPSKIPIRCSKLFCPAFDISEARTESGTWPTKLIPCLRASSAMAKTASRGISDCSLMKSARLRAIQHRPRDDHARADQSSGSDFFAPLLQHVQLAAHVAHAGYAVGDEQRQGD